MSEVTQDQMDRLWKTVNAVSERTLRVETLVETNLASREWVKDELGQIKEAVGELAIQSKETTEQLKTLSTSQLAINAQQSELMKQRAEQEIEKHEADLAQQRILTEQKLEQQRLEHEEKMKVLQSKTLLGIISNWSPVLEFIGRLVLVLGIITAMIVGFLKYQGFEQSSSPVRAISHATAKHPCC